MIFTLCGTGGLNMSNIIMETDKNRPVRNINPFCQYRSYKHNLKYFRTQKKKNNNKDTKKKCIEKINHNRSLDISYMHTFGHTGCRYNSYIIYKNCEQTGRESSLWHKNKDFEMESFVHDITKWKSRKERSIKNRDRKVQKINKNIIKII